MPTYEEMYPEDYARKTELKVEPKTKAECISVEEALTEIGLIALKGKQRDCPGCGRKQGYIFFANDVRMILYKLLRALEK